MILQQSREELGKLEVKGLTTAATIWIAAGLGATQIVAYGLSQMGVIGMIWTLVTLSGVKKIQKSVRVKNFKEDKTKQSRVMD